MDEMIKISYVDEEGIKQSFLVPDDIAEKVSNGLLAAGFLLIPNFQLSVKCDNR